MTLYIYKLVSSDEEQSVCSMESRQLFQQSPVWDGQQSILCAESKVEINRSIFMKWRLDVHIQAQSIEELYQSLSSTSVAETYKITVLQTVINTIFQPMEKAERHQLERSIGSYIVGNVDLKQPEIEFGVIQIDQVYYFGQIRHTENLWIKHQTKPQQYSTALSTRLARTLTNIAVPYPEKSLTFVDPCCGIGTVLLEVASLGIQAEGFDINPVVLQGTRLNLAHFQYDVKVTYKDMLTIDQYYDVAVLDLPYNLCSVLAEEVKIAMLQQLCRISARFLIVSIEPILPLLQELNISICDQAVHYKGKFKRELFLCKSENAILLQ